MIRIEWITEWLERQKISGQYVDMLHADWAVLDGDFDLTDLVKFLNSKLEARCN